MYVVIASGFMAGANYLASERATDAQQEGLEAANALERQQFQQSRQDTAPWREAGAGSLNYLQHLMGTGPSLKLPQVDKESFYRAATTEAPDKEKMTRDILDKFQTIYGREPVNTAYNQGELDKVIADKYDAAHQEWVNTREFDQAGYDTALAEWNTRNNALQKQFGSLQTLSPMDYQKSPDFNFRLQEGVNAIDRSAASRGQLRSGNTLKAITGYGQNLAAGDYQNYLNQQYQKLNPYLSIAGLGQVSANQASGNALQFGQSMGNNAIYSGSLNAQNITNQTNALTEGLGNIALYGNYLQNRVQ